MGGASGNKGFCSLGGNFIYQMAIIGISHLVAASDVDSSSALPAAWEELFHERGVPVQPEKVGYLPTTVGRHDFIFYTHISSQSPILELIRYNSISAFQGHYSALFGPVPNALRTKSELKSYLRASDGFPWRGAGSADQKLAGISLDAADMDGSIRFWSAGVGFSIEFIKGGLASLKRTALMPAWSIRLFLLACADSPRAGQLHDRGWNCLSLLATDLAETADRLLTYGATSVTPVFSVTVKGVKRDLIFLRGPSGEVVELLQVGAIQH